MKVVRWEETTPTVHRGGDIRVLFGPRSGCAAEGLMGVLTLRPGDHVAEHYHPFSEKLLYVTRGRLTIRFGEETSLVTADEGIRVSAGTPHRIENRAAEPAACVFSLSPLPPHPRLDHVDTEALPAPPGPRGRADPARPGAHRR